MHSQVSKIIVRAMCRYEIGNVWLESVYKNSYLIKNMVWCYCTQSKDVNLRYNLLHYDEMLIKWFQVGYATTHHPHFSSLSPHETCHLSFRLVIFLKPMLGFFVPFSSFALTRFTCISTWGRIYVSIISIFRSFEVGIG